MARCRSAAACLLLLVVFAVGIHVRSAPAPPSSSVVSPLALRVARRVQDLSCRNVMARRRIEQHSSAAPTPQRGGAAASSFAMQSVAAKTMTARQFEAFNLLSGGVAGTVASCITNPLEVIKTQLQSSNAITHGGANSGRHPVTIARRILETDGVRGFFRGLPPTLVGIIPSRSAYFYAYQTFRSALGPYLREGSPPNALVSGFMAGLVGNTLTNPIWMVRTRMQLLADASVGQLAYANYGEAIRSIYRQEGLPGFYRGMFASYWGCTEGAAQFIMYEQFKTRLLRRANHRRAARGLPPTTELPKMTYFWSAALAKMLASIATYPHEVARTRLREQARSGVFKYHGMWQTLRVIAREEGRAGLYSGMGVHLIKTVPNSALMFVTYEIVRAWLGEFTIVERDAETPRSWPWRRQRRRRAISASSSTAAEVPADVVPA